LGHFKALHYAFLDPFYGIFDHFNAPKNALHNAFWGILMQVKMHFLKTQTTEHCALGTLHIGHS
jgi:hypothetical protein